MRYKNNGDVSNFLMLDGDKENIEMAARVISDYTQISNEKIKTFIMAKGLKTLFDNPSIIGVTPEQIKKLIELKDMVDWEFDSEYETI